VELSPAGPWHPALRPEVERVAGPGGVAALRQPRTGHVVKIGRVTRALLPALDGTHKLESILESAVRAGASRADAEEALRALLLLNFLEGAGDAIFARLTAPDAPSVVTLPGSRFTCHGSGQCCRNYDLGPLEEEDVRRLESLDLARAFPDLGPGPHVRRDESGTIFLERRDERCVFLLPDERCGLHAAFGAEAKPKLCRLYPWRAQLTVAGLRVIDQSECATFATSVRTGEPVASQLGWIGALLPARPEVHHPLVLLDDGQPCDYGWIVALEASLLPLFSGATGPGEAVLAAGRRARALAAALARCPLARGEPDATVAAVLARPLDPAAPSSDDPAPVAAVARALLEAVAARNVTARVVPRLRAALEALAEPAFAKASPPPGEPSLVSEVLLASLRNAVFAGRLLCEGRLAAGLVRFALVPLLTLAGASRLARERGLERGGERELSEAHVAASVGLRTPAVQKALVSVEARAGDVLEAVPGLVRALTRA
jgi:Fe-S-cluster containining protein